MPLTKGKSKKTHSVNVRELMDTYHSKGKIGHTTPRSEAHALQIANAIAYEQAKTSKKTKKKSKHGNK